MASTTLFVCVLIKTSCRTGEVRYENPSTADKLLIFTVPQV